MVIAMTATWIGLAIAWSDDRARVAYPRPPRETVVTSPRTVTLLIEYLGSNDARERSAALGVLRQVRDSRTAQAVQSRLDDSDPAVRSQVLLTLEAILPAAELLPILSSACRDRSVAVRRQALAILGSMRDAGALAVLLKVRPLEPGVSTQPWAAALAQRDEPVPQEIVDELLDAADATVRVCGARLVAKNPGAVSLARRLALLGDANAQVRVSAITALHAQRLNASVRESVAQRLDDSSSLVRRAALEWHLGVPIDLETIGVRFVDGDPTVRAAAIRVAGRLDGADATARLVERLADADGLVAELASDTLVGLSYEPRAAVVLGKLDDQSAQVARLAARTLGRMRCRDAIDRLKVVAANHPVEPVRIAAFDAIGRIGESALVPWLLEAASHERGHVRAAINAALGHAALVARLMERPDRRALAHLLADCHYPDKRSRGLDPSNFTPQRQPPPYPSAETAVATAAVRALGGVGASDAVPALVEVSRDVLRDEAFWTSVLASLVQLGDVRAAPAFLELGVAGQITQGMMTVQLPTSTRVQGLRGLAALRIVDSTAAIIGMDTACGIELRMVAAEVLTDLTGKQYAYRLPVAWPSGALIEDRETVADLSAFELPICYRVDELARPR